MLLLRMGGSKVERIRVKFLLLLTGLIFINLAYFNFTLPVLENAMCAGETS